MIVFLFQFDTVASILRQQSDAGSIATLEMKDLLS